MFVQLDMVVFQIQWKHAVYQVSFAHRMPRSIGVEWSGNVTAAGSTNRDGLGSAVGVLRGIMTSKSCEKSEG